MTLYDLVRYMESVASAQPPINMIVENDIDKLNAIADAQYGVFAFVQGQHSTSGNSDWITYAFTLYYIDRLTEDDSNMLEIQSVGVQTLDNILRSMGQSSEGLIVGNYSFQPFLHSFADKCAGVYVTVNIQALRGSNCPETYTGFEDSEMGKWGINKRVI